MNGLKYVLFIKEYSLQEVANHLGVTAQGLASWSNGTKKIPAKRLVELSEFFGVDADLLQKIIRLEDRIEIERQLSQGEASFEVGEELGLYLQYQALQEKYQTLQTESLEKDQAMMEIKEELVNLKSQVERMIDHWRTISD